MIKIEQGAMLMTDGSYRYDYTTVAAGYQKIYFTTAPGETPEIGDFIVDGKLKKKEGIQVSDGGLATNRRKKQETPQVGKLYEK